ncbi:MAG TPA: ATP-binding protein, partial [Pyrinomonadaceae bacterium]|nr:ATP-binding protein [Pyrinomonadaceae bacterium]
HSKASNARIELAVENGEVALRVLDNGVGFDPADPKPSSGGHGITGMRKRVEQLGGKLQIISEPGTGTTIALSLPLQEQASR